MDARKLAQLAHCMDNHLREDNQKLTRCTKILRGNIKYLSEKVKKLKTEKETIQSSWNDLANTAHEIFTENEYLRNRIRRLEEQLLDDNATESDPEWEANYDWIEERERRLEDNL